MNYNQADERGFSRFTVEPASATRPAVDGCQLTGHTTRGAIVAPSPKRIRA